MYIYVSTVFKYKFEVLLVYSAKFFHFYMFGSINIPQNSPNFLHPSLCYSVCVRRVVLSESEICFDPVSFMM